MKRNFLYLMGCIIFVMFITLILYIFYRKEYIMGGENWILIVTLLGFSISLCGLLLTIWLYNYITYEDVKRNLDEEYYLKKKGIKSLQEDLKVLIQVLENNKLFIKQDLNKQVRTIIYCNSVAQKNPKSELAMSKKCLSKLVSDINQCGLCKKHYSEISIRNRKKIIQRAYDCLINIEVIIESFEKQK